MKWFHIFQVNLIIFEISENCSFDHMLDMIVTSCVNRKLLWRWSLLMRRVCVKLRCKASDYQHKTIFLLTIYTKQEKSVDYRRWNGCFKLNHQHFLLPNQTSVKRDRTFYFSLKLGFMFNPSLYSNVLFNQASQCEYSTCVLGKQTCKCSFRGRQIFSSLAWILGSIILWY